jgi:hypothetical protein
MEPLLRWLHNGDRGYRPGTWEARNIQGTVPAVAYADDLDVFVQNHTDVPVQALKVTRYSNWGHLVVNMSKSKGTGIMRRTLPAAPCDLNTLQRRLSTVLIQGQPLTIAHPKEPIKFLGVLCSLLLDCAHQQREMLQTLKGEAGYVQRCHLSPHQVERLVRTRFRAKARHGMSLGMYSAAAIAALDSVFARTMKAGYGLRKCAGNAFIHLKNRKGALAANLSCVIMQRCRP